MQKLQDWYAPLRALKSLGQLDAGPGSLAGLHEARKRTLSQFFTPDAVARFMWELAKQAMPEQDEGGEPLRYAVLDNSVGSGRLLQFCDPAIHEVGGIDVHAPTIERVMKVFEDAGFTCDFRALSMEGARFKNWSVSLINPPFSLHFDSPLLKPYPSNATGLYGIRKAAKSHLYALHQALEAADVVVALLPRSTADWVLSYSPNRVWDGGDVKDRWRAVFDLPSGSFEDEGADVDVSIVVFGEPKHAPKRRERVALKDLDLCQVPQLDIRARGLDKLKPVFQWVSIDESRPTITLPVTGDKHVRLAHDGRKLRLKFRCGFTQARVINGILCQEVVPEPDRRVPKQYPYVGSARFDLEAHIATGDAEASLRRLIADIEACDAEVEIAPGLLEHLRRRERRSRRQATPMARVIWDETAGQEGTITAAASKSIVTDPRSWFCWVIKAGEKVCFSREPDGRYTATGAKGQSYSCTADELRRDFVVELPEQGQRGIWKQIHPGLLKAFPTMAANLRRRMETLGITEWCDWDYQRDDVIELLLKPRGAIAGHEMGLGKTRIALALMCLSGVKRGLVAMDAYLIPEFVGKLKALPIDPATWQVIDAPEKLETLKRINIISYERLRMRLRESNKTYADRLRRRVGMLIADEGEILSNPDSDQSRAIAKVSPKRLYVLSGTPMASYPRDVHPVLARVAGDGTAAQRYGLRGPYMTEDLAVTAQGAMRGLDAFREEFVTLEWCTWEFREDNRSGAKREVPKIANLPRYRAMLSPHIKRRVRHEPEVRCFVQIPDPVEAEPHVVDFDDDHLGYYLTIADEFARWWAEERMPGTRASNLAMALVRIGAVIRANNTPQRRDKGARVGWTGLTSKQRFTLDRLEELAAAGKKTMMVCHSPETVRLMHEHLNRRGVEAVPFHGGIPIEKRYNDMRRRFRDGAASTLLATVGVSRAGMDIPEADVVLYYDRDWTYTAEAQVAYRLLRPQREGEVQLEWVHIRGSIDEYMAQVVAFKRDSFRAGIDWATPEYSERDFEHMEAMIDRFVRDLARLRGVHQHDLRNTLKRLAA